MAETFCARAAGNEDGSLGLGWASRTGCAQRVALPTPLALVTSGTWLRYPAPADEGGWAAVEAAAARRSGRRPPLKALSLPSSDRSDRNRRTLLPLHRLCARSRLVPTTRRGRLFSTRARRPQTCVQVCWGCRVIAAKPVAACKRRGRFNSPPPPATACRRRRRPPASCSFSPAQRGPPAAMASSKTKLTAVVVGGTGAVVRLSAAQPPAPRHSSRHSAPPPPAALTPLPPLAHTAGPRGGGPAAVLARLGQRHVRGAPRRGAARGLHDAARVRWQQAEASGG